MGTNCQTLICQGCPVVGNQIQHRIIHHLGPLPGQQGFPAVESSAHGCSITDRGKRENPGARFTGKTVSVADHDTGAVITTLAVPTLDQVNYDTTLGKDMIVFDDKGTGEFNKRVHSGDIRLKLWLGFRKNIVVRCTGLVMEGVYPGE